MRWVVCMAVVMVGCVASLPPGDTSITADLAVETARMVVLSRREIRPSPAPASGICERCGGAGYIGDQASIRMQCEACRGTGKKPKPNTVCTTGTCRK